MRFPAIRACQTIYVTVRQGERLPCFRPFTNLTIRLSEESLTHVIPTHRSHDVLRTFCTAFCTAFRIVTTAARHPGIPQ